MSDFPFRNVLVPALFVSSVVFSGMTIPFTFMKSDPLVIETPFFRGEIQPLFDGNNNDQAIRYIGFSIVVGAAAGMGTVEIQRRIYTAREAAAEKLLKLQNIQDEEELKSYVTSNSPTEGVYEEEEVDFGSLVQAFETVEPDQEKNSYISPESLDLESPSEPNENDIYSLGGDELANFFIDTTFKDISVINNKIIESPHQYELCRIKTPKLQQRLLGIIFNSKYYSFIKTEATIENVAASLAKLECDDNHVVITKTTKTYAIWAWEPEACPV